MEAQADRSVSSREIITLSLTFMENHALVLQQLRSLSHVSVRFTFTKYDACTIHMDNHNLVGTVVCERFSRPQCFHLRQVNYIRLLLIKSI